jgi:hypothetical protein
MPLRRNARILIPLTTVLYAGYQLTNRFHLRPPAALPLTGLDQAVPFWLWTVWPYFLLVLGLFLPLWVRDRGLFRRTTVAFTVAVLLNIAVWTLWPTTYPRPPLPEGGGLTAFAYRWLCSIDTPANCFPSGHITSPAIGCWALAAERPHRRLWIWGAFALLSLTILTTKQHYAVDLLGGLATAAVGVWMSGRLPGTSPLMLGSVQNREAPVLAPESAPLGSGELKTRQ